MCLMNIDRQHYDLERNLTTSTITLGRKIFFETVLVYCRNEITCFSFVFVNTIVENEFDGFGVRSVSFDFRAMGIRSISFDISSFFC